MWATLLLQACSLAAADVPLPTGVRVRLGAVAMVGSAWSPPVFAPDGKTLVSARSSDSSVGFWDLAARTHIRRLMVGNETAWAIAYAPDGKMFYLFVGDTIREWDVATFTERRRFPGLGFRTMTVSPDGKWLAVGDETRVLLWDRATGKAVRVIEIPSNRNIHFSPDSKSLAGTDGSKLYVADIASGKEVKRRELRANVKGDDHADAIDPWFVSAAFLGNSNTIAGLSRKGEVFLFDVGSGKETKRLGLTDGDSVGQLACSPDGNFIATGGQTSKSAYLHNLATGKTYAVKNPERDLGINHLVFSPDSKLLVGVGVSSTIAVWETATGKFATGTETIAPAFKAAALSPDGKRAATLDEKGETRLWDALTGKDLGPVGAKSPKAERVVFAPTGKLLGIGGNGSETYGPYGPVHVLDLKTGREAYEHPQFGRPIAFSTDGKMHACAAKPDVLQLWQTTTGKLLHELKAEATGVATAAFSPDGKFVAAIGEATNAGHGRCIWVWDTASGKEVHRFDTRMTWRRALAFSGDSKQLLFAGEAHGVRRWNLADGTELPSVNLGRGTHYCFSADGTRLVFWHYDGHLVIGDIASGKHWRREIENADETWRHWDLSGDGSALIVTQRDGTATVFDVAKLIAEGRPPRPREKTVPTEGPSALPEGAVRHGSLRFLMPSIVTSIAFAPDGKSFLAAPRLLPGDPTYQPIVEKDIVTGKERHRFGEYRHARVALSPDGKTVAAWSDSGLELWDRETGKRLQRHEVGQQIPGAVVFSPDGKMVAAAEGSFRDKVLIHRFMVTSAEELAPLEAHTFTVDALAFSADARQLFSAGLDGIRVWEAATGKEIQHVPFSKDGERSRIASLSFAKDAGLVYACPYVGPPLSPKAWKKLPDISASGIPPGVFSADGKLLATSGPSDPICLWDPVSGKLIRRIAGDDVGRIVLGFSPDGKMLVSAEYTGERHGPNWLRFWDVASGKEIRPYDGHVAPLTALAHSADGRLMASADLDGTIILWKRDGSRLWQQRLGKEYGISALAFTEDGKSLRAAADNTVVFFDVDKKDVQDRWTVPKADPILSLSRDGKTLVVACDKGVIEISDVVTRKKLRGIQCGKDLSHAAVSPSGDVLATAESDAAVKLWHLESGTLQATLENNHCLAMAFSRDGRILATSEGGLDFGAKSGPTIRLWEVATGKQISAVHGIGIAPRALSFAPDGRTLFYTCFTSSSFESGNTREHAAILRDVASFADVRQVTGNEFAVVCLNSGDPLRPLQGHKGSINCVSWSPDGKSVVTGSADGTLLVWEAKKFVHSLGRKEKLSSVESAQLWEDLASADAGRAYRAVGSLAADPTAVMPLLKKRLRAEKAPDAKHVARLLADLGSDQFAVRKKANDELEALGDLVTVSLKQAAANGPALEVARRLEVLIHKSSRPHLVPEKLRSSRALLVLERIATPESRQLLQTIAAGAPGARLTQEARSALDR